MTNFQPTLSQNRVRAAWCARIKQFNLEYIFCTEIKTLFVPWFISDKSMLYIRYNVRLKLHLKHTCTGVFSPYKNYSKRRKVQIFLPYFLFALAVLC